MNMKHLFGPVPSRRLGSSLGIDPVPFKTCSYNCSYCECGATSHLQVERQEFLSTQVLMKELEEFLENHPAPNYITFAGSGEPLLCSNLGEMADTINKRFPEIKLALLTNASLLSVINIKKELASFDLILPSLDAVKQKSFIQINKPHSSIKISDIINGLISLRHNFSGKIWLEIFIIPGINDSKEELEDFKTIIAKIAPDRIQLNSLDRPGTEKDIKKPAKTDLETISTFWGFENIEIISRSYGENEQEIDDKEVAKRILLTVTRRPCTMKDLVALTGKKKETLQEIVNNLISQGSLVEKETAGNRFFSTK